MANVSMDFRRIPKWAKDMAKAMRLDPKSLWIQVEAETLSISLAHELSPRIETTGKILINIAGLSLPPKRNYVRKKGKKRVGKTKRRN